MPIKDLRMSMVRELKTGVFGSLILSDVSIGVLDATYVGIFVILTASWLYCEQRRYTFAIVCFEFGFLVCFRESGFNLKWDKFNFLSMVCSNVPMSVTGGWKAVG